VKKHKLVGFLFILYIPILLFLLFFSRMNMGNLFDWKIFSKEHLEMVNLIPFGSMICFGQKLSEHSINTNIVVSNIAGNVLMLVPMGMALPVLFENKFDRFWKLVVFIVLLVLAVEVLQFVTFAGSADIDDLILNTAGAALGYGIVHLDFMKKRLKI
jgi:glycopeptide antibiotics resistance protein